MATDTTIRQVLAVLTAEYPDHFNKLSEEQIAAKTALFVQALADLDDETLKAAALRHIGTSPFFPKVSELRAAAAAVTFQPAPDPIEAWGQVQEAIRRYGVYGVPCGEAEGWGYKAPTFADPITNHIIRQMGWQELCLSEEPHTDRARFCDAYARIAQRERQQASLPAALQDGALSHRQLAPGDRNPQALVHQIAGALSANRS